MKHLFLFLILLLGPVSLFAQVNDDFSDGNFSINPQWIGDAGEFKVNSSNELQLNSSGESESFLVTGNSLSDSVEWTFWIEQSFPPSSNNYGRVYLISDTQNIKNSPVHGYFLQLGESGGNDAIELFRQDGNSTTSVCRGTDGLISSSFELRIKVIRKNQGNWIILADPGGNQNYQLEATGNDNTYSSTSWFGFLCNYTKSNSDNFSFDDVRVKDYTPDVMAPHVKKLTVLNDRELSVEFSESVTQTSAEDTSNYTINQGIGHPTAAMQDPKNTRVVKLTFSNAFISEQQYDISIQSIKDIAGNVLDTTAAFTFYKAKRGDVVINEIMADPTPQVGLPDAEFFEIHNTADYPVSLHRWTLKIGSSAEMLPSRTIKADSFLIVCDESDKGLFTGFGDVIPLSSLTLTNSGSSLILENDSGQVIHHVAYRDTWYKDSQKEDGGWSLEQMDPDNACAGITNWIASDALKGGTPGKENSMFTSNPDIQPPEISNITILDSTTLKLTFSESMDSVDISEPGIYNVDNSIGTPVAAKSVFPAYRSVILDLSSSLKPKLLYTLNIQDSVADCSGNKSIGLSFQFALFEAGFQDIVISEIMCDPSDQKSLPEVEYLELYNRSDFPVNLGGWKLKYSGYNPRELSKQVILPDSFLIVCDESDKAKMKSYGPIASISSLTLPNNGSSLVLKDSLNRIITSLKYSEEWYKNGFKRHNSGWSLEMIDPEAPCVGYGNWHASISPDGGTPAETNSVNAANPNEKSPEYLNTIYVNPSMFILEINEAINPENVPEPADLEVAGMGNVLDVKLLEPFFDKIQIVLPSDLAKDSVYNLLIKDSILDCAGNMMIDTVFPLAVPELPEKEDILINEVLFEDPTACDDFVEIVNNSGKQIYLSTINLAYQKPGDPSSVTEVELGPEKRVMFDGDIWAFTEEKRNLTEQYRESSRRDIYQLDYMPSLKSEQGILMIKNGFNGDVLDSMYYSRGMHLPVLKETKGISLERVSYDLPSDKNQNWNSAAETAGFATPGCRNSQHNKIGKQKSGEISLQSKLFSPNGDGDRDVLVINYEMDKPGYVGNVRIYDRNGREIRELENNVVMEKQGSFVWDGMTKEAQKAAIGIYLIYVEVFDMDGNVEKYKKTAVLGGRLK